MFSNKKNHYKFYIIFCILLDTLYFIHSLLHRPKYFEHNACIVVRQSYYNLVLIKPPRVQSQKIPGHTDLFASLVQASTLTCRSVAKELPILQLNALKISCTFISLLEQRSYRLNQLLFYYYNVGGSICLCLQVSLYCLLAQSVALELYKNKLSSHKTFVMLLQPSHR